MLVTSITGKLCAQQTATKTEKTFELPASYAHRRFFIDLGKGNTMRIEVNDLEDLKRFNNMDSVIRVFLTDLEPLKDSLGDQLLSRRIDYITDSFGRKEIRIQQFKPKGESYLVERGNVSALKLEQDTVNFRGTVTYTAKYTLRKAFTSTRHYQVSFFVNDLADLALYADGRLNEKIASLQGNKRPDWNTTATRGTARLKKDPSITARLPQGNVAGGNFLNFRFSVDVQNYKSYFVPSFSLGTGVIISSSFFKRDIMVSWDPDFLFARNAAGRLKAYRNDFVTLTWGQGLVEDNEPRLESSLLFIMSLGYLVNRQGEYFDKNTFRLGAGRLSLYRGKAKFEPVMYFNHFFKGVTPGLRWIQSF